MCIGVSRPVQGLFGGMSSLQWSIYEARFKGRHSTILGPGLFGLQLWVIVGSCVLLKCSLEHRELGRWEGGSGWETRVHPWRMHVDVWQNQYNIVKKKKIKKKKEHRELNGFENISLPPQLVKFPKLCNHGYSSVYKHR